VTQSWRCAINLGERIWLDQHHAQGGGAFNYMELSYDVKKSSNMPHFTGSKDLHFPRSLSKIALIWSGEVLEFNNQRNNPQFTIPPDRKLNKEFIGTLKSDLRISLYLRADLKRRTVCYTLNYTIPWNIINAQKFAKYFLLKILILTRFIVIFSVSPQFLNSFII